MLYFPARLNIKRGMHTKVLLKGVLGYTCSWKVIIWFVVYGIVMSLIDFRKVPHQFRNIVRRRVATDLVRNNFVNTASKQDGLLRRYKRRVPMPHTRKRAVVEQSRLPDAIIIGAHKCGTGR